MWVKFGDDPAYQSQLLMVVKKFEKEKVDEGGRGGISSDSYIGDPDVQAGSLSGSRGGIIPHYNLILEREVTGFTR